MIDQRINLYQKLGRTGRDWLNLRFIVLMTCFALFWVVVVDMTLISKQRRLYANLSELQNDASILQKNINELYAAQSNSMDKGIFLQRIKELEQEKALKQQVVSALRYAPSDTSNNFVAFMAALAKHHINGLWFTGLEFSDNGKEVVMSGFVNDPDKLPHYLQKLSKEAVFIGLQFSVFKLESVPGEQRLYRFELRTSEKKQ